MDHRSAARARSSNQVAPTAAAVATAHSRMEANWADIIASLDDAVIVVDPEGKVTFLNPAAETLSGFSARQARGEPLHQLFPSAPWLLKMVRATAHAGPSRRRGEGTVNRPLHAPATVTVTVSPVFDSQASVEGTVLVIRDVSYRRGLEESSRHAERLATLELLSTGLSHEIKNPLGAIKGAAQLLHSKPTTEPEALREYTTVIVREVDRLSKLLDELRDLTQPPPLEFAPVNIHKVLNSVLDVARQQSDWRSIAVVCRFDPSLPDVRAGESKLVQLFLNLLINAAQAMEGEGTLTISTRMVTDYHVLAARGQRGRFLSIEVHDTGPGISKENEANLFAPFFTTKPSGSGLGLAISHQIVAQHAGRLTLKTAPGGGALARVILPVFSKADRP